MNNRQSSLVRRLVVVSGMGLSLACGGNGGKAGGGEEGGSAGLGGAPSGGSGAGGTDTAGAAGACPGTGGPPMVVLPEGYCIDSTEVTRAHYQTWLSTSPPTTGQTSDCTWNTTFTPDAGCMSSSDVCQSGCDDHPQVCVDWCDAYAYCQAVGKRLCGKIGGGPNDYRSYADFGQSQWYNACTSHGLRTASGYPYSQTYDAQACNGYDYSGTDYMTIAVGTLSSCQASGLYAGVFDLSGNVWEWEDSCNGTGQSAYCRLRGGSFYNPDVDYLVCGNDGDAYRVHAHDFYGFRCCSP